MAAPIAMQHWFQNQLETLFNHHLSQFLAIFLFFCLLFLHIYRVRAVKSIHSPPSPPKLPIIGHLHCLGTLPHRSLQALSQKYGPLMQLQLGYAPALVVSSARMGEEFLKTHDIVFSNRPTTKAIKVFLYGGFDMGFSPYGEYWRWVRRICVVDLLSVKRVESFRFIRDEEITSMVNKIKHACLLSRDVNLSDFIISVTSNVTSRIALGRSLEGKSEYAAELVKQVTDLLGAFSVEDMFPSLGWVDAVTGLNRKMGKASKAIHHFLDEVIEDHLTSKKEVATKDFVDILLEAQKDSTLGTEFTRKHLRTVLLDMFVAGSDTTYTTTEWAMAELANHPSVMKKLQQEVRQIVGTKAKVDENDINQMEYLNCVIKETLRLHPTFVLSFPRVCTASVNVEGYDIPAKTRVLINLWAISRDPKIWERPDEFIPERFINSTIDYKGNDFEFIPFGAGRRSCPGMSYAITSVESVLANLLYWFDWEFGGKANKVDMTETFGLSVRLKFPMHLLPISHFS